MLRMLRMDFQRIGMGTSFKIQSRKKLRDSSNASRLVIYHYPTESLNLGSRSVNLTFPFPRIRSFTPIAERS